MAGKSVYVIDLSSGEKTIIEGFSWTEDIGEGYTECVINSDGTKLLISCRSEGSRGYDSIGVLDFAAKSYIELPHGGLNINEHAIYWFDADCVIIATDSDEGGGVYIYSFRPPT